MTKSTWTFLQGHPPEATKFVIFQLPVVPTAEWFLINLPLTILKEIIELQKI